MTDRKSFVQARYAFSILRVAKLSDREAATRLVAGLAVDFPVSNTRPEVTALHQTAIAAYERLAVGLRDNVRNSTVLWLTLRTGGWECWNKKPASPDRQRLRHKCGISLSQTIAETDVK